MTTASNDTPKEMIPMAFTPRDLTKATTFRRTTPSGEALLVLRPGEPYLYERTETETHVVHTGRVTRDGFVWYAIERLPKTAVTVAANRNVAAAMDRTAKDAAAAVGTMAARQEKALDADERRVRGMDRAARMLCGDVYQVNYYIPEALGDKIPNPSYVFRRHGFRLDGSNWVFPAAGLNSKAVQEVFRVWDAQQPVEGEAGPLGVPTTLRMRYWVIKYTPEQLAQMRDMAQTQLAEELVKVHRSLIARIDAASQRLAEARAEIEAAEGRGEAVTERDRAKADDAYAGAVRGTVRDAIERFEMCLKGAELFDDGGSLDALFGAVRDAVRTQALAVNARMSAAGRKMVKVPATIGG